MTTLTTTRRHEPPVRLTARGRTAVLLVLCGLVLAAFSLGRAHAATVPDRSPAPVQATVHPGDTLWSVAQRVAPRNDPREVIARIRELNHLAGSDLVAGEQLLLPAG